MHGHHDIDNFEYELLEPFYAFLTWNSKSFPENFNSFFCLIFFFCLNCLIQPPKRILNSSQLYELLSVLNSLRLFEDWLYLNWSLCRFLKTVHIIKGRVKWLDAGLFLVRFELFFELWYFILKFLNVELFSLSGLFSSKFRFFGFLLDFGKRFLYFLNLGWVLVRGA